MAGERHAMYESAFSDKSFAATVPLVHFLQKEGDALC
jgi:aromatic ring-cleaving dioxygenase